MGPTHPPPPAAPARSSTARRHQALHDALLAAADEAIAREGIAGLRARALAERAGCSVGAIYNVFADLDALALAVNGRTLDAIEHALRAAAPAPHAPAAALVALAEAYLAYVTANPQRCEALFTHRMAAGGTVPAWYLDQQGAVFAHVEGPLAKLRPDLDGEARARLARTLFSAVHGVVSLGLDQKLATLPPAMLAAQLRVVVEAIAAGLAAAKPA